MSRQVSSVWASTAETNYASDRRVAVGGQCGAVTCGSTTPPPGQAVQDDRRVDAEEHRHQGDRQDSEAADAADRRRPGPIPGPMPRRSSMFSLRRPICQRMAPSPVAACPRRDNIARRVKVANRLPLSRPAAARAGAAAPHRRRRRGSAVSAAGRCRPAWVGSIDPTAQPQPRAGVLQVAEQAGGEAAEQGGPRQVVSGRSSTSSGCR